MVSSTGPAWSLYPLLAILSFCTFSMAGTHLFFCLPFFAALLPLVSGVLGLLASFHSIFLRYPNRTAFSLQLIASVASFFFFFSSSLETFCLSDIDGKEHTSRGDICDGVFYRTESIVGACVDLLNSLQQTVLNRAAWKWEAVRIGISSTLTVLAASQLLITTALAFHSASETKLRIRVYHYQIVLGIILFVAGLFHWRFCCLYYFVFIPSFSGAFCILQGVLSWKRPSTMSRGFDMAGAALSLILFSSTLFSVVCWASKIFPFEFSVLRHCEWCHSTMKQCRRTLAWSQPYFHWQPDQVEREVAAVQLIIYGVLTLLSLLYFYFSIKGTFTLKQQKHIIYLE